MGLLVASTSLVVMQLSNSGEQGRNASSLQVGEALGGSVLAGAAGTWFVLTRNAAGAQVASGGLLVGLCLVTIGSAVVATRVGVTAELQTGQDADRG